MRSRCIGHKGFFLVKHRLFFFCLAVYSNIITINNHTNIDIAQSTYFHCICSEKSERVYKC